MLEKKRDLMAKLLTDVGFKPTIPEGGYFMMADTSDIGNKLYILKSVFQQKIIVLHLFIGDVKESTLLFEKSTGRSPD